MNNKKKTKWDKDAHAVCSQDCEDVIGCQGLDEFTKKKKKQRTNDFP